MVLDIAAVRMAVLMGRKFVSFLQDSQKNLAVVMGPRLSLARPEVLPEPLSVSPGWVSGELALKPMGVAYRSGFYSQLQPYVNRTNTHIKYCNKVRAKKIDPCPKLTQNNARKMRRRRCCGSAIARSSIRDG